MRMSKPDTLLAIMLALSAVSFAPVTFAQTAAVAACEPARNVAGEANQIGARNVAGEANQIGARNVAGDAMQIGARNVAGEASQIGAQNVSSLKPCR